MAKYQIVLNYVTTTDDSPETVRTNLRKMLGDAVKIKISRLDGSKFVHGTRFDVDNVLSLLITSGKKAIEIEGKTYTVNGGSERYLCFYENPFCVVCNTKGTKLVLERNSDSVCPHFNLYTDNDVLMTKDHIIARAAGGKDHQSNYQTMCMTCNNLKASFNLTIGDVRKLREYYDANPASKERTAEIHRMRLTMSKPPLDVRPKGLVINQPLRIIEINGQIGVVAPKAAPIGYPQLGSISVGTKIFPIATRIDPKEYWIDFNGRMLAIPKHMTENKK